MCITYGVDKIVVLADGAAKQDKSNELLNKNGSYSYMVKLQTENQ